MNKKTVTLVFLIIVLVLAAGLFYFKNLRGIWPAVNKPSADIAQIIEDIDQKNETTGVANQTDFPLKLPKDFYISVYAKNLGAPRVMSYDPKGRMLVSIPTQGAVVALTDTDNDGIADKKDLVIDGLNKPNGLAWRCDNDANCTLYIAESDQVATYKYDNEKARATNKKKIISLPDGGIHYTRTIMFMPVPNEDKILISIGSSCNVCHEDNEQRAKIFIANYDGSDFKEYARGLRNSVFMAIHPVTGQTWATEMGRDLLGDDLPPDEINIIEEGKNYGWPNCYGKNIHDTVFDKNTYIRNPCMEPFEQESRIDVPSHSAPLGLAFIPEEGWPQDWWYNALVAYHGSWNRTVPTGYKIVRYKLGAQGNYLGEEDFISGWLDQDNKALGRPVDILIQPGGTIFISDDKAGVIYRVIYRPGVDTSKIDDKSNLIKVEAPLPGDLVTSPMVIRGEARGYWYFEASFPVELVDDNGQVLVQTISQADGEWMTEDFVPFNLSLEFTTPSTNTGKLILKKDNPSGLPENEDQLVIPVKFR